MNNSTEHLLDSQVLDIHNLALCAILTVGFQVIFFLHNATCGLQRVKTFGGGVTFGTLAVLTLLLSKVQMQNTSIQSLLFCRVETAVDDQGLCKIIGYETYHAHSTKEMCETNSKSTKANSFKICWNFDSCIKRNPPHSVSCSNLECTWIRIPKPTAGWETGLK